MFFMALHTDFCTFLCTFASVLGKETPDIAAALKRIFSFLHHPKIRNYHSIHD